MTAKKVVTAVTAMEASKVSLEIKWQTSMQLLGAPATQINELKLTRHLPLFRIKIGGIIGCNNISLKPLNFFKGCNV